MSMRTVKMLAAVVALTAVMGGVFVTAGFAEPPDPAVSVRISAVLFAPVPPPPLRVEYVTLRPGPRWAWVPGHWMWRAGWVWVPGHWVRVPRGYVVWEPGYWARRPGGWIWVEGYWR
jgi:hypothetical protein